MEKYIDTQEHAPGKNISWLIRPCVESPLLSQHFEINNQSDVTDRLRHCQFPCLDIERGEPSICSLASKLSSISRPGIDPAVYILQGKSHGS